MGDKVKEFLLETKEKLHNLLKKDSNIDGDNRGYKGAFDSSSLLVKALMGLCIILFVIIIFLLIRFKGMTSSDLNKQPIASTTSNVTKENKKSKIDGEVSIDENPKNAYTVSQVKSWMWGDEKPDKKLVFLTIDDGPSKKITPKMLDILKDNGVKATFFYVTGLDFMSRYDVVKRAASEGHQIGLHSHSHDYRKLYPNRVADEKAILSDLKQCEEEIKKIIPSYSPFIMRFPGGSFSFKNTKEVAKKLKDQGIDYIDWNLMTGDADNSKRDKSPQATVQYIENDYKKLAKKDVIVLLMHDSNTMKYTKEALPSIIKHFKDLGYEFAVFKRDKN